jgi:hypothetical protein
MTTLTEGKHAAEFLLSEASGERSREQVVLSSTAAALVAGTVLGKVTASGEYVAYATGASDGSETAVAILFDNAADLAADQKVLVIARDAEVIEAELTSLDAAGKAELAAVGIIVR